MAYVTLEYDGEEKALGDWGFALEGAEATFSSMATDVLSLRMPGVAIEDDPIIPFEGVIVFRRGRTVSGGGYAGGVIEFQGKRLLSVLEGRPQFEGVTYQFGGPWYDLDQTPFQQTFKYYDGDPDDLAEAYVSDLTLFTKFGAVAGTIEKIDTGEQLTEIFNHLLGQYSDQGLDAPFQVGTIDPAVNVPSYQVKDIKCSEAVQICLRVSPDCTVWFDYSFSPPKVHVRNRAGLAAVSLGIRNGTDDAGLRLVPRYDLQPRAVVLYFKRRNEVDGTPWLEIVSQKYPTDGPDGGLRVIVQTIDLQGSSRTDVFGELKCATVQCNDASQSVRRAWWGNEKHKPELVSGRIRDITIETASITDEAGATVSLSTYPNELVDGSIADWMRLGGGASVVGVRALLKAKMGYKEYDAETGGNLLRVYSEKEVAVHLTLTNGITGSYSVVESEVEGEAVPEGLAQSIYDALSALQYEGVNIRLEEAVSGLIGMGNVLNLTGGRSEWSTMRALVQTIHKDYGRGMTEISIGPARHLSAGDLTQLFLINRFRRVYYDPTVRATATARGDGSVQLQKNMPKENATHGLETHSNSAVVAPAAGTNVSVVRNSASAQEVRISEVDEDGDEDPDAGSISAKLSEANGKTIKLREFTVCDEGVARKVLLLGSEMYD